MVEVTRLDWTWTVADENELSWEGRSLTGHCPEAPGSPLHFFRPFPSQPPPPLLVRLGEAERILHLAGSQAVNNVLISASILSLVQHNKQRVYFVH